MTDLRSDGPPKPSLWLRFVNKAVRFLVHLFLEPLYLPISSGPEKGLPKGKAVLLANHHNILDPIFIINFSKTDRISIVSKKELFRNPIIATVLNAFQAIRLDRDMTDLQATRSILNALRRDRIVGLFLQGTRVPKDDLESVDPKGPLIYFAIRHRIPVVLVGITPNYRIFGRPRYTFSDPVLMTLKNKKKLTPEEQQSVAFEVMRQIYQLAGLSYEPKDMDHHRAVFEREIEVLPFIEDRDGQGSPEGGEGETA